MRVLSVVKVFTEAAKQGRGVGLTQTYTRRRRNVGTGSGGVSTASESDSTAGGKAKDKGKEIMQEPEPPKKLKKRVQVQMSMDEEIAKKMFEEEQAKVMTKQEQERMNLEAALELQRKLDEREEVPAEATQATQEHDIDWNDPSVLRYHAQLNRPYSVAEVWDQTQSFMPMDSEKESKEKAKERMKRKTSKAREDKIKRQKTKDDPEKLILMEYVQVVSDSEEAINVIPLAVKSPIVSWKSYCKGDMGFYEIHKADGNYKTYKFFSEMLKDLVLLLKIEEYKLIRLDLSRLATTLNRLERSIKSGIYSCVPDGCEECIFVCQDKYVDEILKKFGFSTVKTASTPIETSMPLLKNAEAKDVDVHLYRSMIGSLMYLTASRPDIMFVVCTCTRFQVTPKGSHLHAMKRIFRYLKGQPKLGLWYPKDSPFDLEAYTDSDYAGASLDRKSTTGGCQFLGRRLISWQCKKQTIVANSTTEAEYVAASSCCGQVLWIQNQMLDYGYNFMNTKIHIDNESTICIVKNPVFHSKTKHIEIRHHFIRDSNEKKLIQMIKIHTDHNVADLLTKAFDVGRFQYLIASIGMLNP
ncbi:hypothetical protein Tco_0517655 [Tanacetum coccineum]